MEEFHTIERVRVTYPNTCQARLVPGWVASSGLFRGHFVAARVPRLYLRRVERRVDVVEMGLVLRSGGRVDGDAARRSSLRVGSDRGKPTNASDPVGYERRDI